MTAVGLATAEEGRVAQMAMEVKPVKAVKPSLRATVRLGTAAKMIGASGGIRAPGGWNAALSTSRSTFRVSFSASWRPLRKVRLL